MTGEAHLYGTLRAPAAALAGLHVLECPQQVGILKGTKPRLGPSTWLSMKKVVSRIRPPVTKREPSIVLLMLQVMELRHLLQQPLGSAAPYPR